MIIKQLDVYRLRNITYLRMHPDANFNIIAGANACGKSAILEAIHLLSLGRSFRTQKTEHLIQFNADDYSLFCNTFNDTIDVPIGLKRQHNAVPVIHIAGESQNSLSALAGYLPVLFLSPDSVELLTSAKLRRQWLDWGVFHVEPSFLRDWKQYTRLIKQRNAALKTATHYSQIGHWDVQLTELAQQMDVLRVAYMQELQPVLERLSQQFLNLSNIQVHYSRGWDSKKSLAQLLQDNFQRERQLGFTSVGAHKADLRIKYNQLPVQEVLSRGQQKLLVLALKLAQNELLVKNYNIRPIILIDDLAAELDPSNLALVIQHLVACSNQTFITTVQYDALSQRITNHPHKMFHVEHGGLVASM